MTTPDLHTPESRIKVIITPMGIVDEVAVKIAAAAIQTFLDLRVDVDLPVPLPEEALMAARDQYDAAFLIRSLKPGPKGFEKRVGLTSRDIALPFLTYLYGEAQVSGRAAVISTFRLKQFRSGCLPKRSQVYERLTKVTVHETAHLLGLVHCPNNQCIMNFSAGLAHLDSLALGFCVDCTVRLTEKTAMF